MRAFYFGACVFKVVELESECWRGSGPVDANEGVGLYAAAGRGEERKEGGKEGGREGGEKEGGSRPSFTTWFNLEWTRATFAILLRLPNSLQTIIVAHGAVFWITLPKCN